MVNISITCMWIFFWKSFTILSFNYFGIGFLAVTRQAWCLQSNNSEKSGCFSFECGIDLLVQGLGSHKINVHSILNYSFPSPWFGACGPNFFNKQRWSCTWTGPQVYGIKQRYFKISFGAYTLVSNTTEYAESSLLNQAKYPIKGCRSWPTH